MIALALACVLLVLPAAGCASSSVTPDAAAEPSATASGGGSPASPSSVVAEHGQLRVEGGSIVDAQGRPFQVRGVSTHGLAWYPQYVSAESFATWRDWGANAVRLALYTEGEGGWCATDDAGRSALRATLYSGIDAAVADGMYVIVDWHILSDGNPLSNEDAAKAFFAEVVERYKGSPNVIYEICNEPNGGTGWGDVSAYAADVIPLIRAGAPDALVVVGTPNWSQEVDEAAASPLPFDNVAYALHFYAATHRDALRATAARALEAKLPLLVTEFGVCEASGDGALDEASADEWIRLLDEHGVGYVCWNLSNKAESSSLVSSGCDKLGGWQDSDLSAEGAWYEAVLRAHA
jgi:endoglucanase